MTEELSIEMWTIEENVKLHKQLEVAKEALKYIYVADGGLYCSELAQEALAEIDKIDNSE
jgi:hypothetical protein